MILTLLQTSVLLPDVSKVFEFFVTSGNKDKCAAESAAINLGTENFDSDLKAEASITCLMTDQYTQAIGTWQWQGNKEVVWLKSVVLAVVFVPSCLREPLSPLGCFTPLDWVCLHYFGGYDLSGTLSNLLYCVACAF
jgi:hypothetical protein